MRDSAAILAAGSGVGACAHVVLGASASENQAAVACLRRDAAEAAHNVLRQGGNAVDAAVAAVLVEFVIEPSMVGLGGYGSTFVMYDAKSRKTHAINSTARAPRNFDPKTFSKASATHGPLAVGVPGNVAGIDVALREFGTMSFAEVAKRAIEIAEQGTPVTQRLASQFGALKNIDVTSRRAYFPNGVPAKGATWKQPDLARLMRRLGEDGPSSFYSGDVPAIICKQLQAGGGTLAEEDFHEFRATKSEPLHIRYRGFDLYSPELPSGGITCFGTLKTLEQFDVAAYDSTSAAFYDLFINAANLAWEQRERYFGDPEFVKVPVEELLSDKRAEENAEKIRKGLPKRTAAPADDQAHTVNVVVVDKNHNVVSWTATHGNDFGSHVAIDGLGLMLGHGMSRFDQEPASPNYPAPRKRPVHNMSPMVVLRDGRPYAGLGMPGGQRILSVTTQMLVNLIDFKAAPREMVAAPRVHTEGRDVVQVNHGVQPAVIKQLRKMGHQVKYMDPLGGDANAIVIDEKTGRLEAAAGSRSDGVMVE